MVSKKTNGATDIEGMSIAEKIGMLSDSDRDYLRGYIDRAIKDNKPASAQDGGRLPEEPVSKMRKPK